MCVDCIYTHTTTTVCVWTVSTHTPPPLYVCGLYLHTHHHHCMCVDCIYTVGPGLRVLSAAQTCFRHDVRSDRTRIRRPSGHEHTTGHCQSVRVSLLNPSAVCIPTGTGARTALFWVITQTFRDNLWGSHLRFGFLNIFGFLNPEDWTDRLYRDAWK